MSTCNTGHLSEQDYTCLVLVSCKSHFYVLLLILICYHTSMCFTNKFDWLIDWNLRQLRDYAIQIVCDWSSCITSLVFFSLHRARFHDFYSVAVDCFNNNNNNNNNRISIAPYGLKIQRRWRFSKSLIEQKSFKFVFKNIQKITDENCLWQRVPHRRCWW